MFYCIGESCVVWVCCLSSNVFLYTRLVYECLCCCDISLSHWDDIKMMSSVMFVNCLSSPCLSVMPLMLICSMHMFLSVLFRSRTSRSILKLLFIYILLLLLIVACWYLYSTYTSALILTCSCIAPVTDDDLPHTRLIISCSSHIVRNRYW